MSLTLTSAAAARFRSLAERLLSPLDYADLSTWASLLLHDTCELHHADRAQLLIPLDGSFLLSAEGIPPATAAICGEFIGEMEPGLIRMKDPVADRAVRLRHAVGLRIWSHASMEHLAGSDIRRCEFYQEYLAPAGLGYSFGIRVPLPKGDAHLAVGFSRPQDDTFGIEDGEELIGMLLPSFCAGVHAVRHFYDTRSILPHAIDELQLAIALFDADGREVHRSPRLCAMLAEWPDADNLTGAMRAMVNEALALRRQSGSPHDARAITPVGCRQITHHAENYRLRAVFLPSSSEAGDAGILLEVESNVPRMPTIAELHARGLTERETQVAALLAIGASNTEIAERLHISRHTARKHAEHIFDKLGVHTRKAFLLALAGQ